MASRALWLPLVWLFIIGSRPVSTWLGFAPPTDNLEGSPLDASVFFILIVAGLATLWKRKINWSKISATNPWIFAFFFYCLLSVIWSDYSFVAFKRWVKDFGNVVMILVILTEKDYVQAMKAVFLRYAYIAIPLSVVFIKYFPELGRYLERWTWQNRYCGITTEKNALGALVLVSGLFLIWDLLEMLTKRQGKRKKADGFSVSKLRANVPAQRGQGHILLPEQRWSLGVMRNARHGDAITVEDRSIDKADMATRILLLCMVVWLLTYANSSNALVCFSFGACILFVLRRSLTKGQVLVRYLGTYTLILTILVTLLYSVTGILVDFMGMIGRDMTLTGRTDMWATLLNVHINPLIGSGYQSFWFEANASLAANLYYFVPNQAHNGYLETYLNGGLIGVCLLIAMILSTGGKLKREILLGNSYGILCFSLLVVSVLYNWAEAIFNKQSPIWIIQLVSALNYPCSLEYTPENSSKKFERDISELALNRNPRSCFWSPGHKCI